jgi:hypothetical protein
MVTTTKYMKKQPKKKTRKFAGGGFVNSFNDSFKKFKTKDPVKPEDMGKPKVRESVDAIVNEEDEL